MKKILILIRLLFSTLFVVAQINDYTATKTFQEQGYTYQCDVDDGNGVKLYNKNNKWTYVDQMKKGTNEPFYITPENFTPPFAADKKEAYIDSIYKVIVNNAFAKHKERIKGNGRELFITTFTDSSTGKISEVCFRFSKVTPYATVPVSVYREIETQLVGLQYTLNPIAKTLNYVYQWWAIEPK